MRIGIAKRILAVPLILAVFLLVTATVCHAHDASHDEDHCTCQVCHVGHAAIPQPAAQAQLHAPIFVTAYAPTVSSRFIPEATDVVSSPRAPPE